MSSKPSDPVHLARAQVALAARLGRDDTSARQQLKEAKLARWVREALDTAPPLTDEQRHRLGAMLTGGGRR